MVETSIHGTIDMYPRLDNAMQMKDYFIAEIRVRETMSKTLGKYIASFDYFNKTLLVSSATSDGVSITLFLTVIGEADGKKSASLGLVFSINKGNAKKNSLKYNKKKKKKQTELFY